MQFIELNGIGKPASRLVFGTAYPEMLRGDDASGWMDTVLGYGFNTIDTAQIYGLAETALGKWIASRSVRDKIVLITKGCHPSGTVQRVSPECIREDFDQSLDLLQTDHVDIYLLHRDDPGVPVGPLMDILNDYIRRGKTARIGASNWSRARIAEANRYAKEHGLVPFTYSSPHYSLARQVRDPWGGCVSIAGPEGGADRKWYAGEPIQIFAYASLSHGFLSGKVQSRDREGMAALLDEPGRRGYVSDDNFERLARAEALAREMGCGVAQIALAYVLHDPLRMLPVVSTSKEKHLKSIVASLDVRLTERQRGWLDLRSPTPQ